MKVCGLLMISLLFVAPSARADVGLIGLSGRGGAKVKRDLISVLSLVDRVIPEPELTGGERVPKKEKARARWVVARARAKRADAVVVAEVSKGRLRVAVYSASKFVEERRFGLRRGRLSTSEKGALGPWLEASVRGAVTEGKGEGALSGAADALIGGPVGPGPETAAPQMAVPETAARDASGPSRSGPERSRSDGSGSSAPLSTSGDADGTSKVETVVSKTPSLGESPVLFLRLDFEAVARGFGYNDPITDNLRPYRANFMPMPGASLELFPFALLGTGPLASIGLFGAYHRTFGVESHREGGPVHPTQHSDLLVGFEYRVGLGSGPPREHLVLIPSIAWHQLSFVLEPSAEGTEETELPSVDYKGIRLGAAGEVPLSSRFSVLLEGVFIKVVSPGDIVSDRFLRAGSANGLAFAVGGRIGVTDSISIELVGTYQHYFFAFSPEPGDRFVAGGALDQFAAGRASLRFEL